MSGAKIDHARRGFTLVEIMAALLIVGIVAAAIIPALVFSSTSAGRLDERDDALARCRMMADSVLVMDDAASMPPHELAGMLGAELYASGDARIYNGSGERMTADDVTAVLGARAVTLGRRFLFVCPYGDGHWAELEVFAAVKTGDGA